MTKCPQCGDDNPENSNFCQSCGEKLNSSYDFCPKCGKENSGNSKFCTGCGANLERRIYASKTKNNLKSKSEHLESENFDEVVALDLTPAESLMIMDQKTLPRELLKVTFIDLFLKMSLNWMFRKLKRKVYLALKRFKKLIFMKEKTSTCLLNLMKKCSVNIWPVKLTANVLENFK